MPNEQLLDPAQFFGTEAKIPRQGNRSQPEFGREIVAIHVYVRWFIRLMAVEIARYGPVLNTVGAISISVLTYQ